MGSADTRDPRDRETETGETLVAGETRRRRGLRRIQGHLRVPLLEATLLTYFTRALLDPRVLAVVNGGSAALCGRYAGVHSRCRPGRGSHRASVSQGKAIGTRMEENGGAERPGHVAGELGRNSGEGERLGARQCRLTRAR